MKNCGFFETPHYWFLGKVCSLYFGFESPLFADLLVMSKEESIQT